MSEAWPPQYAFPIRNGIVHIAHAYSIEVDGKVIHFEMGSYGGPLVITKRGDPAANQPNERHPFWDAFGAWEKQGHRRTEANRCIWDPEPKPRHVKLWRGNYTEVAHDDPRTDEEIRSSFAPAPLAPEQGETQ